MTDKLIVHKVTQEQWETEGKRLFGEDMMGWQFECPVCHHVQTPADFKQFKDAGANPNDAYQSCIGRYQNGRSAFSETGEGPCTYAGFGLLRLNPICVVMSDGHEVFAFHFTEKGEPDEA